MRSVRIVKSVASAVADVSCPTKSISKSAVHMKKKFFSHFMKTLFIPYIKSKYNEVNQNERKAENRCT